MDERAIDAAADIVDNSGLAFACCRVAKDLCRCTRKENAVLIVAFRTSEMKACDWLIIGLLENTRFGQGSSGR